MAQRPSREGALLHESNGPTLADTDLGERAVATEVNPEVLRWGRETAGVEAQTLALMNAGAPSTA